jgi:hypothetical protein
MTLQIKADVDRFFREAPDRSSYFRRNPVTGSGFTADDPIGLQKRDARRALKAREWFAGHAPSCAPHLPLSYGDRERMKAGGLPHIVAWFARSLEARDYNWDGHPSFQEYASGVLACPQAPSFITQDKMLQRRFPPSPLPGLDDRSLCWTWPLARIRHEPIFQRRLFLSGPPPAPLWRLISRIGANIPDWYAPWARNFMQLNDEFIAHATACAPYKRLPRGWQALIPDAIPL